MACLIEVHTNGSRSSRTKARAAGRENRLAQGVHGGVAAMEARDAARGGAPGTLREGTTRRPGSGPRSGTPDCRAPSARAQRHAMARQRRGKRKASHADRAIVSVEPGTRACASGRDEFMKILRLIAGACRILAVGLLEPFHGPGPLTRRLEGAGEAA